MDNMIRIKDINSCTGFFENENPIVSHDMYSIIQVILHVIFRIIWTNICKLHISNDNNKFIKISKILKMAWVHSKMLPLYTNNKVFMSCWTKLYNLQYNYNLFFPKKYNKHWIIMKSISNSRLFVQWNCQFVDITWQQLILQRT